MSKNHTSPFATAKTNAEDVHNLIEQGVEHMREDGTINWKDLPEAVRPHDQGGSGPIGYSRGWLIVRRAWAERHNLVEELPKDANASYERIKQTKVVNRMRNDQQLSWGEISVRLGIPESRVRALYRANDTKQDKGLRIGKGGRFAFDDGNLYRDNRKKEGAWIPLEVGRRKPSVQELLNFVDQGEAKSDKRRARARATGDAKAQQSADQRARANANRKVAALKRLLADKATPVEQHQAIKDKIADLVEKYNLAA